MNKVLKISGIILGSLGFIAGIWFSDLGGIKSKVYVGQIVKMRVSPKRLSNLKMPSDYGMDYKFRDEHERAFDALVKQLDADACGKKTYRN